MPRRAVIVVGVLAALPVGTPAAAQDQQAAPPVVMDVVVGLEGYADPAEPLPVRVDLSATELIVGRLEVVAGGVTTDVAIEVPAGGAKRYDVMGASPGQLRSVTVTVYRTGADGSEERIANSSVRLRIPRNELLVGLLGIDGIETSLRSATTLPVAREVVPVTITSSPGDWKSSLLPYVVADEGALGELDDTARAAIERWVRDGGRLYGLAETVSVIADPSAGTAWPAAGAVIARVGDGEVGAIDPEALTVEQWGMLLRSTPPLGLVRNQSFSDVSFALLSAASAGREAAVPALPWLLGGIGLFVVLVGPVNFVLLRRLRKPELAWATVPLLSALFVAGFWFVGRAQLEAFTISSASVVIDSGGTVSGHGAFILQVEASGGHDIVLQEGWRTRLQGGGGSAGTPITTADGRSGLAFELEDLGVGTAQATWDQAAGPPVSVALADEGNQTVITVTNGGESDYWGWGIIANGAGYVDRSPLPAGATASITARIFQRSVYEPVISDAINRRGYSEEVDYGVVNSLAAFAEAEIPDLRRKGLFFFGLTSSAALPVEVDGKATTARGPGLVVKEIDPAAPTALTAASVQPELLEVTGASSVEAYYEEIYAYGADQVYFLYAVPADAPAIAEIQPSSPTLVPEAFRWETEEFERIEWGRPFDLKPYLSPGGDLVVRTSPVNDEAFFEQDIRLSRYALQWSTA